MHPHYAFIVCTSCKESKNGAANNKIMQLEVSTILGNKAVSVGSRILTLRGNVVPVLDISTIKTNTLCCLETFGSVYPVTALYLSWMDASAKPVRKLQTSHNAIFRYFERMKVLRTISSYLCGLPHSFQKGARTTRCHGEGPTTIIQTSSVEKGPCEETAQMVKDAPQFPSLSSWSQWTASRPK